MMVRRRAAKGGRTASNARHHAEWLSLIEVSGPFLSMPVLERAFPQGLDAHDPEHRTNLHLAYDEWLESQELRRADPAIHQAWVRFVIRRTLEFPDEALREASAFPAGLEARFHEHHETLRPDLAIVNPEGGPEAGKPRLLVQIVPMGQGLEKPIAGKRWHASPAARMMELLHATRVRLGLVTNGEQWMLVDAPRGETTGYADWLAALWFEEAITLRAFRTLLSVRRFFGVAETEALEALLAESSKDQQEVTDQLGLQVRVAVEVLVQAIDRIDKDRGRTLLEGIDEKTLYNAALTVMMRLVFLFSAEERGLLLLGDPLYDANYAVSTLRAELREDADRHGEEVLERRSDAWARLLATFRGIYGGVEHERVHLLAYGGTLFDPDRFSFLEGRRPGTSWRDTPSNAIPINNRTVLHLLQALQELIISRPGGGPPETRQLSFRALDIEQIGHVYEGLLDHTARRARLPDAPMLGLAGTREKEPEVPLPLLEELRAKGKESLLEFLCEETGRSEGSLRKSFDYEIPADDHRFLAACDNDEATYRRVIPFAGLVRDDTSGVPVIIAEGSVFVTQGSDRRSTATHYTPRSLTEPIVQHTLEPLVYDGPAEGEPRERWKLRSARKILGLRVCDPAMGSGAFLVQACRFLSERLVESWEEAEAANPGRLVVTPEGDLSTGDPSERPIPKDPEERLAIARRTVADRCLYGVDLNPMAVEMAKLSLWLVTLQKNRPFTFLDHALRCGDSLLGLTSPDQIEWFHLDPKAGHQLAAFATALKPALASALEKRRKLESFPVNDIRDAEEKARLLREAEAALEEIKVVGDLVVGAAISTAPSRSNLEDLLNELAENLAVALDRREENWERPERMNTVREKARAMLDERLGAGKERRQPFHWMLEFPEVFAAGGPFCGFDAIVGNPPFRGGKLISGALGTDYREYLVGYVGSGVRGHADLCAYFFLRAYRLLSERGGFAMLATNTIAQGDTREVGLETIEAAGGVISRAISSRKWPGAANLEVAVVWVHRGGWRGEKSLDEKPVEGITPFLVAQGEASGKPHRLKANEDRSFIGTYVLGMGFLLTPDAAHALIGREASNRDVLFPYLNGEDLNSRWDQSPSRWVINFRDWPLHRGGKGSWRTADEEQRKEWLRTGIVPDDYSDPVAADYPACLAIVEEKVKPERQRKGADGAYVLRKPLPQRWWHFADKRPALYRTIAGIERVLVTAQTSRRWAPAFQPLGMIYSHTAVVFPLSEWTEFAILQCFAHEEWRLEYGPSLRLDARYTPSDCFETFPFPENLAGLANVGRRYYELRASVMSAHHEGLTSTYSRCHDRTDSTADISGLRNLHIELDYAVAAAYGWTNVDLDHGFHDTKQGLRFTISDAARRDILARLLKLNHARYAEEVARGLHEPRKGTSGGRTGGKRGRTEDGADTLSLFERR